jgi:oligoendopeptidase F
MDAMGALSYRVWYFAALHYDQDQRDNASNARRQQVQILFARQAQAGSWFNPELLTIPIETIRRWLDQSPELGVYRFAIESLFHEQEHVLDEQGERLMSYAGRFNSVPYDSYSALTTADMKFPSITLIGGEQMTLTYGQYRALLETNRNQDDRARPRTSTSPTRTTRTPTPRSTTACSNATGFMPGPGYARAVPRSTATTSRPPSSGT